jgi:enterochelin esterase-like enzyme
MRIAIPLILAASLACAQKVSTSELLAMAHSRAAGLEQALRDTLGAEAIRNGTAAAGELGEFVWAVESEKGPSLQIDHQPPAAAFRAGGLWVYHGSLQTGRSYRYRWLVEGRSFGGSTDLAAFGPDSYARPDVPEGRLTGPLTLTSTIYPNMTANVWYYVPAQWDGRTPLAVQVWGDGQQYTGPRPSATRVLETIDNLTAQKRIPLMAQVFVQPGTADGRSMRSIEYDTVSDTYPRYLVNEVLAEIGRRIPLRTDAYSRAIAGMSSGGIAAFNAAFQMPDQFSRVLSWIGSYAALQVSDQHPAGGGEYPFLVRRGQKRNIRVWLADGSEDLENQFGSWPAGNINLANALKIKGYDYRFSWGTGAHSQAHGAAELPESMTWLWRDYDPAKTSQEFVQEEAEKDQPFWRVVELNRR